MYEGDICLESRLERVFPKSIRLVWVLLRILLLCIHDIHVNDTLMCPFEIHQQVNTPDDLHQLFCGRYTEISTKSTICKNYILFEIHDIYAYVLPICTNGTICIFETTFFS